MSPILFRTELKLNIYALDKALLPLNNKKVNFKEVIIITYLTAKNMQASSWQEEFPDCLFVAVIAFHLLGSWKGAADFSDRSGLNNVQSVPVEET